MLGGTPTFFISFGGNVYRFGSIILFLLLARIEALYYVAYIHKFNLDNLSECEVQTRIHYLKLFHAPDRHLGIMKGINID